MDHGVTRLLDTGIFEAPCSPPPDSSPTKLDGRHGAMASLFTSLLCNDEKLNRQLVKNSHSTDAEGTSGRTFYFQLQLRICSAAMTNSRLKDPALNQELHGFLRSLSSCSSASVVKPPAFRR
ncbi:hypothetical protein SRHO_G00075680 [Serrasalmus rhombeus]